MSEDKNREIEILKEMMLREFDLGDPATASVEQIIRAIAIKELNDTLQRILPLVGSKQLRKILEVYLSSIMISQEDNKNE